MTAPARSERLQFRASTIERDTIAAAATATRRTVTDFVMESAMSAAEHVLAEQRTFTLSPEQWDRFVAQLEAPLGDTPRLDALAAMTSPFRVPAAS